MLNINVESKNRKIIEVLSENSQTSLKKLSRCILSSQQATFQRIRRLEKTYIRAYMPVVDIFKLGYSNIYFYLKISGLSQDEFTRRLNSLTRETTFTWIARMFGDFDLSISILYKSRQNLIDSINKVHQVFGKSIVGREIFHVKSFIIPTIKFSDSKMRSSFRFGDDLRETYTPTDKQTRLLNEITSSQKKSIYQISQKLRMSPKTVRKNIQDLRDRKVILGHTIMLNYEFLECLWTSCIIYVTPGIKITSILTYLQRDCRICWIAISIENNIMFDFLSKDFFSLRDFVNSIKVNYQEEILGYKLISVERLVKFK